jgi:uncharacterized protein with HEPN domain
MIKDDLIRFRHMLDAANEASAFTRDKTRVNLDGDRMLLLSVTKLIEIIGEAANKITDHTQEEHPEIEWASIIGMRNKLSHGYFDIDTNIVWATITEDLPPLIETLERIIDLEGNMDSHPRDQVKTTLRKSRK